MKKAVCISCTHHYNERIAPVEAALRAAGYEVSYITSDYNHYTKQHYRVTDLPHCEQLPTLAYTKNISPQRMYSHIRFAKDAFARVEQLQPDLVYAEVPPNSLCRVAARYKKRYPQVKLIFDIFDLWPESFPNHKAKALLALPFRVWGNFRNKGLPKADLVLTECDLFRQKLAPYLENTRQQTLYLCHPGATTDVAKPLPEQAEIHLCYLGFINNLIDIPTISALLGQLRQLRPVVLHIIGDGETREDFISAVEAVGVKVEFHGKIYDSAQKQAIFDKCSFGLNIMKTSVCIGLTMKSLDYFGGALPIINTISGDTQRFVEDRGVGINVCREDLAETARKIAHITPAQQLKMGESALQMFNELFTEQVFQQTLLSVL